MITLFQPGKIVFGDGSIDQLITDYLQRGLRKLFIVTIPSLVPHLSISFEKLRENSIDIKFYDGIAGEPSFNDFEKILEEARAFQADSIAGIGGGSVLDVAKLLAVQVRGSQTIESIVGMNRITERNTFLACIPTTSGTGSEMSPNAIFLDDKGNKTGVISPFLVPDVSYVDPSLTISVPASITAATGIDALSHCLEAYTNKFAHPVIDLFALEGIRLVGRFLRRAYNDGTDLEARAQVALASMYGGMCLGPVNTAGVHALAYPLGADYHLSHGLSIALLLPGVMEFNLSSAPARYAEIALALGATRGTSDMETGAKGISIIRELISDCGLPGSLREAGIDCENIDKMAADAMKVQRLLKNNIREITQNDAASIYRAAYESI